MRKRIQLLLMLVLLLSAGCTFQQEKLQEPVRFYYPPVQYRFGSPDSVLHPEIREGQPFHGNIAEMLTVFLQGPLSAELRSPFPVGTVLVSTKLEGDTLYITLSNAFSALEDAHLTLACACIARTCLDYIDCVNVSIATEDSLLDGEKSILMNAQSILLYDSTVKDTTPTDHH